MNVVVWEQNGLWSAGLRRLLDGHAVRVVEARTCEAALSQIDREAIFLVVEANDDLADTLCAARQFAHNNNKVPFAVVVSYRTSLHWQAAPAWQTWLAAVRQAGAVDVFVSPVALPLLARCVSRRGSQTTAEESDLRQGIWNRLPWK